MMIQTVLSRAIEINIMESTLLTEAAPQPLNILKPDEGKLEGYPGGRKHEEQKLMRAWKKRWFILRSGRMSGDPDVLEYYKNEHSKKPLRIINLNLCEQVDAGLTFNKKELQDSFVFDIKTSERTFYLVAETEADMNKWVQSICQICGFNQAEESTDQDGLELTVLSASASQVVGLQLCITTPALFSNKD
ncbi:hypothetical protein STEG23_028317, partial [Scotinomys teguina]